MNQEVRETRFEPNVEYMYSPSRDQITPMQGLLLKMNASKGDWCLLTFDEPSADAVNGRLSLELRKLNYRNGMTEAELQAACAACPSEGINVARENARHALIREQLPAAKRKAELAGKIAYSQENWQEQMRRDARGNGAGTHTIDLSKAIPQDAPLSNPAGKTGVKA